MDENKFFKKEMERLEQEQNKLRDRYNQEKSEYNQTEYEKIINSKGLKWAPHEGETIGQWLPRYRAHLDVVDDYAEKHLDWFTHNKDPRGCFICEYLQRAHALAKIMASVGLKYPDFTF